MKILALAAVASIFVIAFLQLRAGTSVGARPEPVDIHSRLSRLSRGVNLSHWFAQGPGDVSHLQDFVTADDMAHLRNLGTRHVRISVDPDLLIDRWIPGSMSADSLTHLDRAITLAHAYDLAVVIDLHPEPDLRERLANDDRVVMSLVDLWRALAQHLSATDPELVMLEVLNEPGFPSSTHWTDVQRRLLAAIREGAPAHTLIATGYGTSTVQELTELTPVADPNVVYAIHFYEPVVFTHQGAAWGPVEHRALRKLPYPSDPGLILPALSEIREPTARVLAIEYGEERWTRVTLDTQLREAANWARRHNVHVICTEFGVYRSFAPPESRVAWVRDVRELLELHGIGWTFWDYTGDFGLVREDDDTRVIDPEIARALGLNQ